MVVIMVGIANYAVYLMTGKSPFSTDDLSAPSLALPLLPKVSVPSLPAKKDTAYKWTDEKGVVHYTTEPPQQASADLEKLEVNPGQNVIQSVKPRPADNKQAPSKDPASDSLQSPYSPGAAKKLIEDAKNVQNLLNERYERQNQIIDSH